MNTLTAVPRDRWQRPLIQPPGGGKAEPYTRCTTYVGALEDTNNLEKWKMRQVAIGLVARPDLLAAVRALHPTYDKSAVNAHCEAALEAAASSAAANVGTALHKLTEADDLGVLDLSILSPEEKQSIYAYRQAMVQAKLTVDQIETFVVHDGLKIGGTFDRTVNSGKRKFVFDVKTGSLDYGMGKIAMQLAVYAHSRHYNPETFERTDLDVDLERAIVCHLPAGTGKCILHWVDIAAGWEAVQLASQVRSWRARKNLSEPFEAVTVQPETPTAETDEIIALIEKAPDVATLNALWSEHMQFWTPHHSAAAKARKSTMLEA